MNRKDHCQACTFKKFGVKTRKLIPHTCGLDENITSDERKRNKGLIKTRK
jgi:hypothetical protein